MFSKHILPEESWYFGPKKKPQNKPPGPIFDLPESPVHSNIKADSGDKVEALETTEKAILLLLKRSHIHLVQVRHTYKLKKIIFHTQLFKNHNCRKGYPENRGLVFRPIKYSTYLPGRAVELVYPPEIEPVYPPEIFSPVVAAPKKLPWNFHRAKPRSI